MACSNCFNGCADIVSDQCVKYTGIPIPALGINTGDPLLVVENQITAKILTLMDGSGIIPILAPGDVCTVVSQFLPCCPPLNLNQVLTAFVKAICDIDTRLAALKDRVIIVEDTLVILNSDYSLPLNCLTGVTASSDTHDILQATINKVCSVALDLSTNYVLKSDVNSYIQNYIASNPVSSLMSSKMVPYVPVPYFGPLNNYPTSLDGFGSNGIGFGAWAKVYFCNGQNGTPDLRGVTLVGATAMGTNSYADPAADPANGNFTYNQGERHGLPNIVLTPQQLAPHTHTATTVISQTPHRHKFSDDIGAAVNSLVSSNDIITFGTATANISAEGVGPGRIYQTSAESVGITAVTTLLDAGFGNAHSNIQPSCGTYYIIYIP